MKKIKIVLKCFGLILLYLILGEITGLIASFYKNRLLEQNIILIIGSIITTIVLLYIFREKIISDFKSFKENHTEYLPKCVKYWAIGFVITYILNILIAAFFLKGASPNEEANRLMIKSFPIYMALSACLVAPICEEILFRLSFKELFKRRITYALFTGILFGAAHLLVSTSLADLIYILPYSALGITFGLLCFDTDNICSSIFAHILHNTITYLLLITFI